MNKKQEILDRFDNEFFDNGPLGEHDSIKQFISQAIDEIYKDILSRIFFKAGEIDQDGIAEEIKQLMKQKKTTN